MSIPFVSGKPERTGVLKFYLRFLFAIMRSRVVPLVANSTGFIGSELIAHINFPFGNVIARG